MNCALLGFLIGQSKGIGGVGLFLGFLLGVIGLILVAAYRDTRPTCPYCKGTIVAGARRCKNCGSRIPRCPACNKQVGLGRPRWCEHCDEPLTYGRPVAALPVAFPIAEPVEEVETADAR